MATPHTARRAALVLAGALGLAFAPAPAGAEEPATAAEAAALVAARGHELEVLTEDFNEARELLAGQQAAAQAAAAAVTEAQAAVDLAQDSVVGVARTAFTGESLGSFQALMTSGSAVAGSGVRAMPPAIAAARRVRDGRSGVRAGWCGRAMLGRSLSSTAAYRVS